MVERAAADGCFARRQNCAAAEAAARTELFVPSSVGGVATVTQFVAPRFVVVCNTKLVAHEGH